MREATLFGRALPDGGCIGVPAPSSPYYNRSDVLRGVEWWEALGYRVKLAEGIWERDDYVAGDPRSRARDVMAMFCDPEVDVVQCLQGGFGAAQVVPHLDFDEIGQHPKALCGFSDITALHVAIRQRTGLATLYSNGMAGMGSHEVSTFSKNRLLSVLRGDTTGEIPRDPDDPYVRAIAGGRVTAPIAGGNFWLQIQTLGTPWEIDLEGCIWFFEDIDTPPWHLDGFLEQLFRGGKLDGVLGVVVGDMEKSDWRETRPEWPRTKSLEDVLEMRLGPLGVPILYKLPLGHAKHLAALPLGVQATLDAEARTLTIDRPALLRD